MKKRKLPRNKSSGLCLSRKQKGKALPVNWDKNRQCDFLLSFDLHQEIVAEFTVQDLNFFFFVGLNRLNMFFMFTIHLQFGRRLRE